ncbi:MAG: phosphatidylserine decarboxylase [Campylobacterota bacterium]|nr:phosphatidylserine decarboxylase [Campylobacterota bacterium]
MHITNRISRIFGKFASKPFPSVVQNIINYGYVKLLGLDMREFKRPSQYKSLNALFTRALISPRDIDMSEQNFVSPADSFISEAGTLKRSTLMQIKGMDYNVSELLTQHIDSNNINKVEDGAFMNFYLSPKDYHRYHASYACKVKKLIHVPGVLYPVNFTYLRKEKDLFVQNERVILECETNDGKLFYMVFVGALNVGEMVFEFEPRVETNTNQQDVKVYEYENQTLEKGDCIGWFKMGSTVVMVWEKDLISLNDLVNKKVNFGTIVADML